MKTIRLALEGTSAADFWKEPLQKAKALSVKTHYVPRSGCLLRLPMSRPAMKIQPSAYF